MSVLNDFIAKSAHYSIAENTVYIVDEHQRKSIFKFTVRCKKQGTFTAIHFFFNTNTHQCLVLTHQPTATGAYICHLTRFWLRDDLPVLSVKLFDNQESLMHEISDQFTEQYASLILDGIINQD
jgi:hypothetical protein